MKEIARYSRKRKSDQHRPGRGFCREREDIPRGMRKFARVCDIYPDGDWISTNHLKGIFNKFVGQPWDDCYSHICAACDPRFIKEVYSYIRRPVWAKEYWIEQVVRVNTTYILDDIKRKSSDYIYKTIGEELVPAQWMYLRSSYGQNFYTLEWMRQNSYYQDQYYIEGETGLVRKIPAIKDKPKEIEFPHLEWDYSTRKAVVKVMYEENIDGLTHRDKVRYKINDIAAVIWEKRKENKLEVSEPKSLYTVVFKGYNGNEPILVLKRIKTK